MGYSAVFKTHSSHELPIDLCCAMQENCKKIPVRREFLSPSISATQQIPTPWDERVFESQACCLHVGSKCDLAGTNSKSMMPKAVYG